MYNRNQHFETMKKQALLIFISFLLLSGSAFSQKFPYSTFQSASVTYLGLDFTHARFVDELAFQEPSALPKLIKQWNHMSTLEPEKYNFAAAVMKDNVKENLEIMDARNAMIDPTTVIQNKPYNLNIDDIPRYAGEINFEDIQGLAAFFIVETYDKPQLIGSYYFVIYDVDNDEVLFVKKYVEKPRGFGLKNFWARTYYLILEQIKVDMKKYWSKGK